MKEQDLFRRPRQENTLEFRRFKEVSQEDSILVNHLSRFLVINENTRILDVGGRDGKVGLALQSPSHVTIVESDPDVLVEGMPCTYIHQPIQEVLFEQESFDIIIFSHLLGDLGRQCVQKEIIVRAISWLRKSGNMVLYYNTNVDYIGQLVQFAQERLIRSQYDYFDESIFGDLEGVAITEKEVDVPLSYDSFEELSRACWLLFGSEEDDAQIASNLFLQKLRHDLDESQLHLGQKIVFITKN